MLFNKFVIFLVFSFVSFECNWIINNKISWNKTGSKHPNAVLPFIDNKLQYIKQPLYPLFKSFLRLLI